MVILPDGEVRFAREVIEALTSKEAGTGSENAPPERPEADRSGV
jgi:hypothetical protein